MIPCLLGRLMLTRNALKGHYSSALVYTTILIKVSVSFFAKSYFNIERNVTSNMTSFLNQNKYYILCKHGILDVLKQVRTLTNGSDYQGSLLSLF